MKVLAIISTFLILSFNAYGIEKTLSEKCQLRLTQDQKEQIKTSWKSYWSSRKTVKDDYKAAKKAYWEAYKDEATTYEDAAAISDEVIRLRSGKKGLFMDFKTNLLFNILSYDQRTFGWRCIKRALKRER